ncbi:hypothetical protein J1N35_007626 [Gossypium stocksii]|uniref:Uncharacterized protein n=1 Tax=Gossypium stocksii TaxID=47602 RepID=A0A9D3W7T7_9ROSI|nr:hypothetical protein J1N35_007626 [Gossypium stocksii]
MHELRTRIRRKVGWLSRGRITRLQCKYLAFVDPYKYEIFDVISETCLEMVISSHISSGNIIIELYVEFIDPNGFGPSSTIVAANMGTESEVQSPTTHLCCGFSGLLQSGYYDVLGISMGSHSSVSNINLWT